MTTARLDVEVNSLDDLRRHLAGLSESALQALLQSLQPQPREPDILAAVQAELGRRRSEQRALPELLDRLDRMASRLRAQPGRIPRRRYTPPNAQRGTDRRSKPQASTQQPTGPQNAPSATSAPSNVVQLSTFLPKLFHGGRSEPYWVDGES